MSGQQISECIFKNRDHLYISLQEVLAYCGNGIIVQGNVRQDGFPIPHAFQLKTCYANLESNEIWIEDTHSGQYRVASFSDSEDQKCLAPIFDKKRPSERRVMDATISFNGRPISDFSVFLVQTLAEVRLTALFHCTGLKSHVRLRVRVVNYQLFLSEGRSSFGARDRVRLQDTSGLWYRVHSFSPESDSIMVGWIAGVEAALAAGAFNSPSRTRGEAWRRLTSYWLTDDTGALRPIEDPYQTGCPVFVSGQLLPADRDFTQPLHVSLRVAQYGITLTTSGTSRSNGRGLYLQGTDTSVRYELESPRTDYAPLAADTRAKCDQFLRLYDLLLKYSTRGHRPGSLAIDRAIGSLNSHTGASLNLDLIARNKEFFLHHLGEVMDEVASAKLFNSINRLEAKATPLHRREQWEVSGGQGISYPNRDPPPLPSILEEVLAQLEPETKATMLPDLYGWWQSCQPPQTRSSGQPDWAPSKIKIGNRGGKRGRVEPALTGEEILRVPKWRPPASRNRSTSEESEEVQVIDSGDLVVLPRKKHRSSIASIPHNLLSSAQTVSVPAARMTDDPSFGEIIDALDDDVIDLLNTEEEGEVQADIESEMGAVDLVREEDGDEDLFADLLGEIECSTALEGPFAYDALLGAGSSGWPQPASEYMSPEQQLQLMQIADPATASSERVTTNSSADRLAPSVSHSYLEEDPEDTSTSSDSSEQERSTRDVQKTRVKTFLRSTSVQQMLKLSKKYFHTLSTSSSEWPPIAPAAPPVLRKIEPRPQLGGPALATNSSGDSLASTGGSGGGRKARGGIHTWGAQVETYWNTFARSLDAGDAEALGHDIADSLDASRVVSKQAAHSKGRGWALMEEEEENAIGHSAHVRRKMATAQSRARLDTLQATRCPDCATDTRLPSCNSAFYHASQGEEKGPSACGHPVDCRGALRSRF